MSTLTASDIKTLEQTRQRLSQLTSSLSSLQSQLLNSADLLPPWPTLHSHLLLLSTTLSSLSTVLRTHAPLLSDIVAYPLPAYPGREQEGLLTQIMRKRLEPGVEEWVAGGVEAGRIYGGGGKMGVEDEVEEEEEEDDDDEDVEMGGGEGGVRGWRQLWESAPVVGNEEARKYDWGGVGEEEGEEEEDGDGGEGEKVEKGKERGVGVDGWLRVLSKGEVGR